MTPYLGSLNSLEWVTELRKPVYLLDYWFMTKDIKGYKSTTRLRDTEGEVPKRDPRQELLSPRVWDVSPSQPMDVFQFTNLEALLILWFRGFYEASFPQHD